MEVLLVEPIETAEEPGQHHDLGIKDVDEVGNPNSQGLKLLFSKRGLGGGSLIE